MKGNAVVVGERYDGVGFLDYSELFDSARRELFYLAQEIGGLRPFWYGLGIQKALSGIVVILSRRGSIGVLGRRRFGGFTRLLRGRSVRRLARWWRSGWELVYSVYPEGSRIQADEDAITVGEDGLDLGLVSLLELDDGSSRECGEHGDYRPAAPWLQQ